MFSQSSCQTSRQANNVVRRAKQHADLCISFRPIRLDQMTIVCHSDAAFANVGDHTRAGYLIAFTERALNDGQECVWNPIVWKSNKLSRAVSSTLAAESQSLAIASGTVEWLSLLLSEVLHGPLNLRDSHSVIQRVAPILVTDCKSLYDNIQSPSSPTSVSDRRTSIDITIVKESIRNGAMTLRWVPTAHMLADALTKDAGDPIDLLRSSIRSSKYHISPESDVLAKQAEEKQRRLNRQSANVAST